MQVQVLPSSLILGNIMEHREKAIVNCCKKRTCNCQDIHIGVSLIEDEILKLKQNIKDLLEDIKYINRKPCNLKSNWQKPSCPKEGYFMVAYNDFYEWHLMWDNENQDGLEEYISWPFVEDYAYAEDFENLGFVIIK